MTKYILVSGGAGFIGINLVKKLSEDPNTFVIVFDNFISSSRLIFDRLFKDYSNVRIHNVDICDHNLLEDFKWWYRQIDEIYHLASIASPKYYNMYPLETLDVGYTGTKNLLDLSRYYKAKILLTSTSEVYGNPTISPQHEGYYGNVNCYGNRSQYDESKRIAETLFYNYKKLYNVRYEHSNSTICIFNDSTVC
jgi:nucleoside-diphosphate-sugar epimerase